MKPKVILFLGLWLIIIPLLGIPSSWKSSLLFLTGAILIVTYLANRRHAGSSSPAAGTFIENKETELK